MSPKSGQLEKTVLQRAVFNYHWKHPKVKLVDKQDNLPESIQVGEEVWVKPHGDGEEEELLGCIYRMWR